MAIPLAALATAVVGVLDKILPDTNAANEAKAKLLELQLSGDLNNSLAQIGVNTEEAKSQNLFVAGWRPWIGWVCGMALCMQYLVRPMVQWVTALIGYPIPELPGIDDNLWELMLGMLGLGSLRTYEKIKRVN